MGHIPLQAYKVSLLPRSPVPARLNRLGSSCLRSHCWPCLTGTHGLSMPSLFSTHHDHKGRAGQPSLPQHTLVPSAMTFILTPDTGDALSSGGCWPLARHSTHACWTQTPRPEDTHAGCTTVIGTLP